MGAMPRTIRVLSPLAAAALGCLLLPAAFPAQPGPGKGEQAYSWVDKNGERHYGDAVPPEYAQSEQRVLNERGVEVDRVGAGKNAQQLAEQKRLEKEAADRAQHDHFLLTTYTSVKDIERLRDERLDQITGQIRAASAYIETVEGRLRSLQQRAMNFKPYNTKPDARRMPDDLAEELVRVSNEVRSQRRSLVDRQAEQENVRSQFQADISRFRELTSRQPG